MPLNQAPTQPNQDSDAQEAYEAFKAYKAFKAQQSQVTPDAGDKAARPNQQYMSPGESATNNYWTNIKSRLADPERYKAIAGMDSKASPQGENKPIGDDLGAAGLVMPAEAAPEALQGIASYLGKSGMARVGANTALGAGQGAYNNPEDRAGGALKGGAAAGLMSGAGEAASGMLGKASDYLMQRAVGTRKNIPGVGNSLADQGLFGTKNRMLGQVEDKLPMEEANLQELVSSLKGNVDSKDIADAVMKHGEKFVSPSGMTLNSVAPDLEKVTQAAGQFDPSVLGAEGPTRGLNPQDLLSLKRQGDWAGYTASGNPASATDAEVGRAIADKSRGLLSDMSGGETAETLGREKALILAKKALEKPETIHQGAGSSLFFGKVPGSSLLGSAAGQAARKGGQAASLFANPAVTQSLTNKVVGQ